MFHFNTLRTAVFGLVFFCFSVVASAQDMVGQPRGLEKKGGDHPAVLRTQDLDVNFTSLKGDFKKQKGAKKSIRVKAFRNLTIDANVELKSVTDSNRGTYTGKTRKGGEVLISRYRDAVVLDIEIGNRHVQIRPKKGGGYVAEEYDLFKFPAMVDDTVAADTAGTTVDATSGATAGDAASLVDVLVVFTSDAADSLGGADATVAFADNSAASFNAASNNSQMGTQVRVVGAIISATASAGSLSTDIDRLRIANDGFLDEADSARTFFGADLVSLISNSGDACGLGEVPGDHTVVSRGCAIGNKSFAHEIGHNFGCAHDFANAGSSTTVYAYGWRFTGNDGVLYRTVMSYNPGARISHFSNPNVLFQGVPTGVAGSADNVRRIVEYSNTVANYRQAVTPPTGSYINFSTSTLAFGSVNINESKTMQLTIQNYGSNTISITNVEIQGAEFSSTELSKCLVTLGSFGSCSMGITFSSTVGGDFTGSVVVTGTGAMNSPATSRLSARAVAPTPNIVVPSSLSFARISTGTVTQSILRISNNGTAALNVTNVQITDSGTGVFAVIANGCLGASLAPGAGCDVSLQFAPTLSGSYLGRVTVTSNDPDQAVVNVSLSGSTAKSAGGTGTKKGGPRR